MSTNVTILNYIFPQNFQFFMVNGRTKDLTLSNYDLNFNLKTNSMHFYFQILKNKSVINLIFVIYFLDLFLP